MADCLSSSSCDRSRFASSRTRCDPGRQSISQAPPSSSRSLSRLRKCSSTPRFSSAARAFRQDVQVGLCRNLTDFFLAMPAAPKISIAEPSDQFPLTTSQSRPSSTALLRRPASAATPRHPGCASRDGRKAPRLPQLQFPRSSPEFGPAESTVRPRCATSDAPTARAHRRTANFSPRIETLFHFPGRSQYSRVDPFATVCPSSSQNPPAPKTRARARPSVESCSSQLLQIFARDRTTPITHRSSHSRSLRAVRLCS